MPAAERLPLLLRYEKSPRVAHARLVLVLALDDQALEDLPPERRQLCDLRRHVLVYYYMLITCYGS